VHSTNFLIQTLMRKLNENNIATYIWSQHALIKLTGRSPHSSIKKIKIPSKTLLKDYKLPTNMTTLTMYFQIILQKFNIIFLSNFNIIWRSIKIIDWYGPMRLGLIAAQIRLECLSEPQVQNLTVWSDLRPDIFVTDMKETYK
jgi:hypothetical protein